MLLKKHSLKRLILDNSYCLKVETYPISVKHGRNIPCLGRAHFFRSSTVLVRALSSTKFLVELGQNNSKLVERGRNIPHFGRDGLNIK